MTTQLAVSGGAEWIASWQSIGSRLHGISITTDENNCDGVIAQSSELGHSAAESHKPVMVPFDVDGLSSLQRQCAATGTLLNLYQPLRTVPSIKCVKEELHSGKLGDLGLIRLHRWSRTPHSLPHDCDIVLWMVGKTPTHVYATGSADLLQVHLGFDENEMAIIDHAAVPSGEYYSLSAVASDGSAYADDHHNMNVLFDSNGMSALTTPQGELFQAAAASDFAEAITNQTVAVPTNAAQKVEQVLRAIEQSQKNHQVVELP